MTSLRQPRSLPRRTRALRDRRPGQKTLIRRCLFEELEDRQMLATGPTILIGDVQQIEGDSVTTAFVFTVTRSGRTTSPSTISYVTSPGSATADADYQPTSGTVVFAAKELSKTITVNVIGDAVVEDDETFYVDLTIVSNGQFGDSRGVGTIVNDDVAPSLPELTINDVQWVEGDSGTKAFVFTVTRSGDLSRSSTVDFATADGTATSGDDYMATNGTLSFGVNEGSQTVTVDVVGDTMSEGNEFFYVDLSNPIEAVITDPRGAGMIVCDDGGLSPPSGLVSWWTADGTAADLMTRNNAELVDGTTFAPGVVGQAFDFDGVDDRVQLPDSASLKLTGSLSIEGWIRADSAPVQQGEILFRGDDRGGLDPYSLSVQSNGSLRFEVASWNGAASVSTPMPFGQMVHVASTLDDASGAMRLYVNGVLMAQTTTSVRPFGDLDPASNPGIGIGNHGGDPLTPHNFPFDGLIDELSVYNRALTSDEVQRIHDAGSQGKVRMTVAKTSPDLGTLVALPPTQFLVDFTYPVDPTSVQAGDLKVNNMAATSVVLTDPDTAQFTFSTSPVTNQGLQSIQLAKGAVTRASDGLGLAEYSSEFRYDVTPLAVTYTDPAAGSDLVIEKLAAPTTAVLSMAGMDGGNGGWPVLYGAGPVSADGLQVVVDEDNLFDTERSHTTEQLGFIEFQGTSSGSVAPYLRTGVVSGVSNAGWTTVTLDHEYGEQMVVVATANYSNTSPPLVVRVRNAANDSFEVSVARVDGVAGDVSGVNVHYVVVQAGVYPNMEAVRFESDVTDWSGSWVGESRSYQHAYSAPVVVGQVMSANDPAFSVFWARGADVGSPPSSDSLFVGKHAGEDPNPTRISETIGYLVIEEGKGTIGGLEYLAGVGGDAVVGMDDGPVTYKPNHTSLQVHFSEPINPLSVGTNDLILSSGAVMRAEVITGDSVKYTLVDVSPGLRVTMEATAVVDQFGNPMVPFSAVYSSESTKFYVIDVNALRVYEYGSSGSSLADNSWAVSAQHPTGIATDAAGTKIWVLDIYQQVTVYDTNGAQLGSWIDKDVKTPNDIAIHGVDVWMVRDGRVHRFSGAATRVSGWQRSDFSFSVTGRPTGIAIGGDTMWVTEWDTQRVYMYTTSGMVLGDWALASGNAEPSGITIDPTGASNSAWVVDSQTDRVYEYERETGEFLGSFALDTVAGNIAATGIADPPPPARNAGRTGLLPEPHARRSEPVEQLTAINELDRQSVGVESLVTGGFLAWRADEWLRRPAAQSKVMQRDQVIQASITTQLVRDARSDESWPSSPVPMDNVKRVQTRSELTRHCGTFDTTDEKSELMGDELLELLAASHDDLKTR